MTRIAFLSLSLTLAGCQLATVPALADAPTTQPADAAATDRLLDGLDACGRNLRTLVANVTKSEVDMSLGEDTESRSGVVTLERKSDTDVRIRASFNKITLGEKTRPDQIEYLLADGTLVDRVYRSKVENRTVVQKPGETVDLFSLGKGPFPLPIGQPKDKVHELFDVSQVAPANDDPPNTTHIRLVPKPETELSRSFSSIDVWPDNTDFLPRRIDTVNVQKTTLTSTKLSDVKLNAALPDSAFKLEPVSEKEWRIVVQER